MANQMTTRPRAARIPACSVFEEGGEVVARLEMPGVPKEGLEIRVEGNELCISGARGEERIEGSYLLRERRPDPYQKVFTIDESIERDRIDAVLENGILTLRLHVKEAAKPRRIEVS